MCDKKRCYNCKFFVTQDIGYSNYTVEGVEIHCIYSRFEPTEESWSWKRENEDHEFFKRAEKCPNYKKEEGVQIQFDVDREVKLDDYMDKDYEIYQIARIYYG